MPSEKLISDLPFTKIATLQDTLVLDDGQQGGVASIGTISQSLMDLGINFRIVDGKYLQLRDYAKNPGDAGFWRSVEAYNGSLAVTTSAVEFIGLDPDALSFIRKTSATSISAIDIFVKGVKALGLWNNMVCWPLRASQNAGSGLTVYSLGGLGSHNGTISGPAVYWTQDGLFSDRVPGTYQGCTTEVQNKVTIASRQISNYSERTFYAAAKAINYGGCERGRLIFSGFAEPEFIQYSLANSGLSLSFGYYGSQVGYATVLPAPGNNFVKTTNLWPFNNNQFYTLASVFKNQAIYAYNGSTLYSSATASGSWASNISDVYPLTLLNGGDPVGLYGTMAFGAEFNIGLSQEQLFLFDTLYYNTLGKGLGLP